MIGFCNSITIQQCCCLCLQVLWNKICEFLQKCLEKERGENMNIASAHYIFAMLAARKLCAKYVLYKGHVHELSMFHNLMQ